MELTKQIIELLKGTNNPEVLNEIASLSWNMYQELKKKGFSDEQAMQITISFSNKK